MRDTLEREVKLVPGEGFELPVLGEPQPTRDFVTTYMDTGDLRLARHGVTFRHRVEDGTGVWQLKVPRGDARVELEEPGPPARPPTQLLELLPAYLRGTELVRVARLRTRRQVQHVDGAEIVDDSVAVLEGQRVTSRFRELEVELLEGDEQALRRLEQALREAGAVSGDFTPKLYRVLDLTYPPAPPELPRTRRRPTCLASPSRRSTRSCSRTILGRGSAPTRRISTTCASRPVALVRTFAPRNRFSTPIGPRGFATSSAGSAPSSGRHAISTSCSGT